ncbi:hypothetical protein KR009_003895 [Drosophila setifemur]|nr:hypothetical protein KR009_003895 [Drosophila setifemur]
MKASFSAEIFQLGVILLILPLHWVAAQDPDIVRTCTAYKKQVFEETSEFSFLIEDAPIITKTRNKCKSYAPVIIGGGPAIPKEFPHAARLGHRNEKGETNWFCGGTLISNRHVLTAAHCAYTEIGSINIVRLGELEFDNTQDDADPEDFTVLGNPVVHPGYDHPAIYNDIAIIRLTRPVTFNEYKHPACLPFEDGRQTRTFIAIGWGQTDSVPRPGDETKILQKVKLYNYNTRCSITAEKNEDLPNGYNATTQLCIGSSENKDTCDGDSGGPVLTYHGTYPCMYHVMGITSVGVFCDTPDIPAMYTRVHFYLDWIKQELAKVA